MQQLHLKGQRMSLEKEIDDNDMINDILENATIKQFIVMMELLVCN